MKPNLIKMDISKQETETAANAQLPFPGHFLQEAGGGAVCVQMEVEAIPPSPPKGYKSLTPVNLTKDDCEKHCLAPEN